MNKILSVAILFFLIGTGLRAETLSDYRMAKRFGIGIAAGGPLAVMGLEVDFNLSEDFTITGGLGTGLDYSTLEVKGKYLLLGEQVSPYFGLGLARWWTAGTREKDIGPAILRNVFLSDADYSQGFSVWMLAPAIGVQFYHSMGLSVYAELQYLFKLFSLANGTYAGLGFSWYF